METNLINRRRRLKGQIPDIKSSLIMIEHLRAKSESKDEIESHFLISDQAYSKATIPPTDKVTISNNYTCKMIECNIKIPASKYTQPFTSPDETNEYFRCVFGWERMLC